MPIAEFQLHVGVGAAPPTVRQVRFPSDHTSRDAFATLKLCEGDAEVTLFLRRTPEAAAFLEKLIEESRKLKCWVEGDLEGEREIIEPREEDEELKERDAPPPAALDEDTKEEETDAE
jgi:hypothetical protein